MRPRRSCSGRACMQTEGISMASTGPSQVDVDRLETWTRYRNGLCAGCVANCCTMPVEVRLPDLVRLQLVDAFEAEHEAPKQIARRLAKAGLVEHFNLSAASSPWPAGPVATAFTSTR